ncbi:hypothetical protein OSB04_018975 [Centaurea solstitialis]|uniref:DUF4219 domain-containing protein n=1 Tax=Centaurea solstitialis TaxID=347529 RepID=A0AA38T7V3_9ASTR|nr:hypothetical protein OSB04_018975 [Centaurea solstitialis]
MASNSLSVLQYQTQLPKLNGRNYFHWSIQMKVMFESQDLWQIIEEGLTEPENPTALTAPQMIAEQIFERISVSQTAKESWKLMFKSYRGEEKVKTVRLQTLRCEFDNVTMKET